MQINPHVPFIADETLRELADDLLAAYEREIAPIAEPPVPVEKVADFLLELNIEWLPIPDEEATPILAYLHPASHTIRLNERRLDYFQQHPGVYEYTLAHEIAHYQLHVIEGPGDVEQAFIFRHHQMSKDRREWQAERFASYLLLPDWLLRPALDGLDLHHWPVLYHLRDLFGVSITALRIRLERLNLIHVAANGRIYPTPRAAGDDLRRDLRRLIGQGQLQRSLGHVEPARHAYQQALTIAEALGDPQIEAFLNWSLGLLMVDSDPAQAIDLLARCVAYEQRVGHPNAETDAAYLARLQNTFGQASDE